MIDRSNVKSDRSYVRIDHPETNIDHSCILCFMIKMMYEIYSSKI